LRHFDVGEDLDHALLTIAKGPLREHREAPNLLRIRNIVDEFMGSLPTLVAKACGAAP
jgi:hypothetical protein